MRRRWSIGDTRYIKWRGRYVDREVSPGFEPGSTEPETDAETSFSTPRPFSEIKLPCGPKVAAAAAQRQLVERGTVRGDRRRFSTQRRADRTHCWPRIVYNGQYVGHGQRVRDYSCMNGPPNTPWGYITTMTFITVHSFSMTAISDEDRHTHASHRKFIRLSEKLELATCLSVCILCVLLQYFQLGASGHTRIGLHCLFLLPNFMSDISLFKLIHELLSSPLLATNLCPHKYVSDSWPNPHYPPRPSEISWGRVNPPSQRSAIRNGRINVRGAFLHPKSYVSSPVDPVLNDGGM